MRRTSWFAAVVVLVAVAGASGTASAQPKKQDRPASASVPVDPVPPSTPPQPPPATPEDPWAVGVTAEQKAEAQRLLEAGNSALLEGNHKVALEQYQQAIESWDHPAIRFNMVRALIYLERDVEAYDNLLLALKYGDAPLEPQIYAQAQDFKKLLLGKIAEIEVSCKEPSAKVTLDGKDLLTCPGTSSRRLTAGAHQLVARKDGFLTYAREQMLMPGKKQRLSIDLVPLTEATVTRRRWAAWKPWAVVGGGAFLAGAGGLLQWKASRDFDAYDRRIERKCADTGCDKNDLDTTREDLARLENRLAIGMMTVGGVALAGGLWMLWLNRPTSYTPEEQGAGSPAADAQPSVLLMPVVTPETASVDLSLRF